MSSATPQGGSAITYKYDALNRLRQKTKSGTTTNYQDVGTTEEIAKTTTGANSTLYAWDPGGPLAQSISGVVKSYEQNLHGDLAAIAASSAVTGSQTYDPYGGRRTGNQTGGDTSIFSFQSDLTDPDTALVDMGTRLYDPFQGRFTTQDVVFGDPRSPMSLNQYVYGNDDPVSNVDPNGMYCIDPEGGRCPNNSSGYNPPKPDTNTNSGSGNRGGTHTDPPPKPVPPKPRYTLLDMENWAPSPDNGTGLALLRFNGDDPVPGFGPLPTYDPPYKATVTHHSCGFMHLGCWVAKYKAQIAAALDVVAVGLAIASVIATGGAAGVVYFGAGLAVDEASAALKGASAGQMIGIGLVDVATFGLGQAGEALKVSRSVVKGVDAAYEVMRVTGNFCIAEPTRCQPSGG